MLNGVMEKKVVLIFYGLEITALQKFIKLQGKEHLIFLVFQYFRGAAAHHGDIRRKRHSRGAANRSVSGFF